MAGAALGAIAAPARAQSRIWLRFRSAWPAGHLFHDYALDFAKKVNDMSGGDLRLEMLAADAATPPEALLDAVHKGLLDGAHAAPSLHFSRHAALALWGASPAFGMDANTLLAWHKHGGGQPLLAKVYAAIGVDVISFLGGPQPPQPLGWFNKPIARPEDLVGLRLRTDPVSAQLFRQLGAQVSALPPAQASAAMAAGALDAAQLTDNAADGALGSAAAGRVCMLGSYHQSAEQFEILIRRQSFDSLPARARAIIENAVEAASQTALWKSIDRYSRAHAELRAVRDVAFYRTPAAVLESQLAAHDALAAARARDPLVVEIEQSQKAFAARALRWQLETAPGAELAYRHYFGAPAPRTPAPRKK